MNLPNRLSVLRLALVPVFMAFLYTDNVWARLFAFLTFIGAGVTDLLDGYFARKYHLSTPLGIFLDPLADKLIVTAALITFVELPEIHMPAWMVVFIVGREFLITGLRSLAASQGRIVAADGGGKLKTALQNTAIIAILMVLIYHSALRTFWRMTPDSLAPSGWQSTCSHLVSWGPYWMMFLATLFSLITGVSYLRQNKDVFLTAKA